MASLALSSFLEQIIVSCESKLIGQKLQSFTLVSRVVKKAMEDALTRILTPQRSTDILREILSARGRGRPYVIVFIGGICTWRH